MFVIEDLKSFFVFFYFGKNTEHTFHYLVDVKIFNDGVYDAVEGVEKVNDLEGSGLRGQLGEAHDVREEHGHGVVGLGLHLVSL